MPTNAEIHAAIDKYITAQRSHILNNTVAQIFHDMVDNIGLGGGGVPTLAEVLAEGNGADGLKIEDVGLPILSDDASTKGYVDDGIEISATFAGIDPSIRVRFVYVIADETNNGDISLYIHNGTILKLVQTLQP